MALSGFSAQHAMRPTYVAFRLFLSRIFFPCVDLRCLLRFVCVTLICDGKPQLTGITANVLTPWGNHQDFAAVLKLSSWLAPAAGGIGRTTSERETWMTGDQTPSEQIDKDPLHSSGV